MEVGCVPAVRKGLALYTLTVCQVQPCWPIPPSPRLSLPSHLPPSPLAMENSTRN